MEFLTEDGVKLFYEIEEPIEETQEPIEEAIVLLNGIIMSTQSWLSQIQFFKTDYTLVLHDFRGQLKSDKPKSGYSMDIHVSDLKELLEKLGIKKCHLVGTSYGGAVGMLFSYKFPDMVKSVSLIATFSEINKSTASHIELWVEAAKNCPDILYDIAIDRVFSNDFRTQHPEYIEERRLLFKELEPDYFQGLSRLALSAIQTNITDKLKEIKCPTLVIGAEKDILLPVEVYSRKISEKIPYSEFVIIPGGHGAVIEKPNIVNTILCGFLRKNRMP